MAKTIGDLLSGDPYDGNDFTGTEGLELWDKDKSSPDRSKGVTIDQMLSSFAQDGIQKSGGGLAVDSTVARTNQKETFNNEVYVSGNVGIRTTSPSAPLSVHGRELRHHGGSNDDPYNSFFDSTGTRIGFVQFRASNYSKIEDETGGSFSIETGGSRRLNIDSNGDVGIGTTSPSYALDVSGTVNASDLRYTSDERLKTDLTQISDPLRRVENLTGYTFKWDGQAETSGPAAGHSAQEIEDVLPEVVDDTQEYKALKGDLTALHTEAIKALIEEVRELREVVQSG